MTIIFNQDGISLPVSQALLILLSQEAERTDLDLSRCTQLTFNFRNPGYSAEQGGVHPVEIRLVRGLDDWLFDYVTDFSYQGLGQDAELCKELDFNFLDGEHFMRLGAATAGRGARAVHAVAAQLHRLLRAGVLQRHRQRELGSIGNPLTHSPQSPLYRKKAHPTGPSASGANALEDQSCCIRNSPPGSNPAPIG